MGIDEGMRQGDGWSGLIRGYMPVQAWGAVDGLGWFFRARWETWGFEVYERPFTERGGLPELPDMKPIWQTDGEYGENGSMAASHMPHEEAWNLIEESIRLGRDRAWGRS